MQTRPLLSYILTGALLTSTVLNVWLITRISCGPQAGAAACDTPAQVQGLTNCLCLSEEQSKALLDCARSCVQERQGLATAAEACVARLEALLEDPDSKAADLESLATELGQLHAQEVLRLTRSILEVRRTLTPEQRAQLADLNLKTNLNQNGACK